MTKRFFLVAAVALLFTACAKDEVDVVTPVQKQGSGQLTIGASFENNATKSDIDDNGNFTWSTEDGIKVFSNTHYWSVLNIVENEGANELGPKFEYANFTSYAFQGDYISTAAVFPKTIIPAYNDPTLSLTIPSEIAWNDASLDGLTVRTMQADNIMVARGFVDGANTLDFKNVGGLFRLTLNNVPTGACKLEFITNKKINGTFAVGTVEENNVEYPVINTSDSYEEGENIVTINFTTLTEPTKMVYFIPVPVGTYQIGFAVKDGDDTVLWEFHSTANNSVARAHVIKMPTLSHITVGGGGEGATNIIVTPTAYSGTVNLPSTLNNIYVKMNETDGTINLEYSSAANAQHPENVYLQALGDITALNINLPDSHVELTGTDANNVQVVTNVSASTTINTFVVDNKVQIGKTEDNQTVGGLTINGGSLDLSAKVEGPVTVVYDVVSETVNKTTEKVSININSAIKDLVVTSASTQSAPDKIYVTLGASSKVNETLSVPETNCNLYIAPGAQAKTVTTSAAENTIAGAIEHLAAEGDGTSVVVEKEGSVTESISSSDRASIVIVERTETEVAQNQAGYITADTATSTQGTIDTVAATAVAMIGSESYSTLADAFAAVADGQTIKLISDVTLEGTFVVALGEKAVTLDLGGKTLTGRTNITSGNLTIQNGNVVNTDGQPLNVYGSDTQGAQNYSVLSVARDVTVTGKYGVCVFGKTASTNGYGAVVNVEGKLIANNGIFVSGNLGNNVAADMNNIVNISGTLTSESDVAVALNGWATVNVQSGAKITGNTGIAVKRGVLNVYDGATVTANGQWVTPPAANNSGTEPTGAAVSMTNTYSNYGAMAVNIAGGSFTSVNGEALYKANQTYANAATFTVTGGSFSSDPSAFVPEGLEAVKNGNVWTVQNSTYKASIGSTLYETLDAAIAAAANGAKIDILVDQTIDKGWTIDKSLEINLNNKTVTFSGETLANYPSKRVFVVTGEANLNIHDGSILLTEHNGNTSDTNLWGTIRFYSSGTLTMTNVVTDNYCKNGLNVKMLNGTGVFNNVTINSKYGGAVEVGGDDDVTPHTVATATFTNCSFSNESTYDWCSTTVATCYNGVANIESGNYSGYYGVYVFSSGGTINVAKGVTITGSAYSVVSEKDQNSFADFDDAVVNIAGGKVTGAYRIGSTHSSLNISGGTYTVDPTAYVVSGCTATQSGNVWTVGPVSGVAAIGNTGYPSLAEAIDAVGSDETITLLKDVTQDAGLLYDKANVSAKFNLNNHTFTVNTGSNVNNRAVKINRGSLEVYGGSIVAVGAGTTSSNGTGCYGAFRVEADGSLNAHDLSLTNSRPFGLNVKVLGGEATLTNVTINSSYGGGIEVTEADLGTGSKAGSATLTNCTFTQTGYFDHCSTTLSVSGGSALTINSGSYTSDNYAMYVFSSGGVITVKDGTFSGDKNGIAIIAAIDTNTYPQYTGGLQLQGGNYTGGFSITSPAFMNITGGTYNVDPTAYVSNGYEAVESNNVWNVVKLPDVAEIGTTRYASLAAAVAAVTDDQTITLLSNVTYDDGIIYNKESVSAKLNLNGKTLTVNTGSNANNRAIRIDNGTLEVYGGSIVAVGSGTNSSNGAGCYGAFRVEGNGVLNAHDLTLTNSRPWGLNVKVVGGVATLTNVTINSSYGGGIEVTETELGGHSKTGSATLTNCTFTQTGYFDHCSTTLSVSGGSELTINSGSYTSDNYAMYVFSSGGVITVNGGTFTGSYGNNDVAIVAAIDTNTYPQYTGGLRINGGTINGGFNITSPAYMSITGGTYDHNPSAYVATGYVAIDNNNGNGPWTVQEGNADRNGYQGQEGQTWN